MSVLNDAVNNLLREGSVASSRATNTTSAVSDHGRSAQQGSLIDLHANNSSIADSDARGGKYASHHLDNIAEEGEIQDELPDDIIVELTRQYVEPEGPTVSQSLKALIESLFIRDFSKNKNNLAEESVINRITKKFQDVPTPVNIMDIVKPATLNEAVASAAFKDAKTKKLHYEALMAEKCMMKIAVSHLNTINNLIKLKSEVKGNASATDILNDTIKNSSLTLEFMGLERHNIRQIRRETVVSSLNPQFKNLAEESSIDHRSNQLFGNELTKRVQDIEQTSKLARRLSSKPYDRPTTSNNSGYSRQHRSFLDQRSKPRRPPDSYKHQRGRSGNNVNNR